ncbi:hypothetical protein [Carnobacterium divergens]|uniref:hypothetical protein n=1 Tax=Carnobacterium divergens TaxID=2748 RepID=UPI002890D9F2|nr:hypothetical protein [Carnobacterium divergens]MDT2010816.1 hypothetical protein [Carnobacterium divergens]
MPSITEILNNFDKFILKFIAFLFLIALTSIFLGNKLQDLFIVCYKLLPNFIRNYFEFINITESQFLNAFIGFLSIYLLTLAIVIILFIFSNFEPKFKNPNRTDSINIKLISEAILPKISSLWFIFQSIGISTITILFISHKVFNNPLLINLKILLDFHLFSQISFYIITFLGICSLLLINEKENPRKEKER